MIGGMHTSSTPILSPSPLKDHHQPCSKDPERLLPIANVSRLMKKTLPTNAKISKEAKETVQECVSEFISFITGEASDKCLREKRKTINGDDLLWAMTTLGFDDYVVPLKKYLSKFRDFEEDKNNVGRHDYRGDVNDDQQVQLNNMDDHLGIANVYDENGSVGVDEVMVHNGFQW